MSEIEIEFTYNCAPFIIQCRKEVKMKDIYKSFKFKAKAEGKQLIYLYNGRNLENDELTFNDIASQIDKNRNKMNILVIEGEGQLPHHDNIIKSKKIICPECKEDINFKINDYKICLYDCKNGHQINDILFDEFEKTQEINISKIICDSCNKSNKGLTYKNEFYYCLTCKYNLCPLCKSVHDKNHNIIKDTNKDIICQMHNNSFTRYCIDCKSNLCSFCIKDHEKHKMKSFEDIIPNIKEINNNFENLKKIMAQFENNINEIINKFIKVKDNLNIYYEIYKNFMDDFEKNGNNKMNYEIYQNLNEIMKNKIINEINQINGEKNTYKQVEKIINIYEKMTGKKVSNQCINNNLSKIIICE